RKNLSVDMLDPSFAVDAPAGDAVVMLVRERAGVGHRLAGLAARRDELRPRRLRVTGLVPGAAQQHRRPAVPAPRHAEAAERLRMLRLAPQGRLGPALAAVGRDHDPGDAADARIGDAADLVVTRPFQRLAERRRGDEALHLLQEVEAPGLAVRQDLRIGPRL